MKAQANRPHCQKPSACDAKGNGHCRRCHMTAAASARNADPEFKAQASARMKARNADPEFKARMKARNADPEFKAQASARMKALHADPEFKARMKARNAGPKGVEIPKWVPGDLHDEYLEYAAMNGEEFAASHCRRLLREARAARTEQIEESARQAASHRQ